MSKKLYISAEDLLQDSFRLGLEIHKSGFQPDFIVGVWRGGTPVGIAVQEILHVCGFETDHIAIRTSSYTGIAERGREVRVHGLDYILERVEAEHKLLIVDDVFDTGLSVQAVIEKLRARAKRNTPKDIRIATPWFKPANNQTKIIPDYYLHESDQWLVFPHEIHGLTEEEIQTNKPELASLLSRYEITI